jgi:hypothetical protein
MKKHILALLIMGLTISLVTSAKVYKYTDDDGNIHYTDIKPFDGAQEADIKPLTIVDSEPVINRKRELHKKKFSPHNFEKFKLVTPKSDSTIWNTAGEILASVDLGGKLPKGHKVEFYFDGKSLGKIKSSSHMIKEVERGEHSIFAQVLDTNNNVVKTTKRIKFYVKQHSKK